MTSTRNDSNKLYGSPQLSARDDLRETFAHLCTNQSTPTSNETIVLDIVKPMVGLLLCTSAVLQNNSTAAMDICDRNMTFTWVPLNTSVPAITYHLSRLLNNRFDCNIFQPDPIMTDIARTLIPEATFIQQRDNKIWKAVHTNIKPSSADKTTVRTMYESVDQTKLIYSNYSIDGLEYHVHDTSWANSIKRIPYRSNSSSGCVRSECFANPGISAHSSLPSN